MSESGDDLENLFVGGYLPLLGADRVEPNHAHGIDYEDCGALSQAGKPTDDVVGVEYLMSVVRQERERIWVRPNEAVDLTDARWRYRNYPAAR